MNTKSTRRSYTREFKLSVVVVPRFQLFTQRLHRWRISTIQYRQSLRLDSSVMHTKRHRGFGGVVNFAFIMKRILGIKRMFPCSFGKGRIKYRVKAAYVIINFVINSMGPPHTLDSVWISACDGLCHTLCVLRPSRASSGTKPRRLQLWKRVAIPQVILNKK